MRLVTLLLIIISCSYMIAIPSMESRNTLYKVNEYTDRYWNGHEWVYLLYPLQMGVAEAASPILSDVSDGDVRSVGAVNSNKTFMRVGDDNSNKTFRSFIKFPISSLHGKTIKSAELELTIRHSIRNGSSDNSQPFNNPELGDTLVIHINDYGALDASDFSAASIGNDPGVLIPASINPNQQQVSISVKDAMQDDINNSRSFTAYMIRTANDTDKDVRNDQWYFFTNESGNNTAPRIEYTLTFTKDVREQVKLSEHDILNRSIRSSRTAGVEQLSIHPSPARSLALSRVVEESQIAYDLQQRSTAASRLLVDSTLTEEHSSRRVSSIAGIADTSDVDDLLNAYEQFTRAIQGEVSISDAFNYLMGITVRVITDTISIDDEASRVASIARTLYEYVTVLDEAGRRIEGISRSIVEPLTSIDIIGSVTIFYREIGTLVSSETIHIIDNIGRSVDIEEDMQDSVSIADSPSLGFTRFIEEVIGIDNVLDRIINVSRSVVDPYSLISTLAGSTDYLVNLLDTIVNEGGEGAVGGGGGASLERSTFLTINTSTLANSLAIEGFLLDNNGIVPFSTTLTLTIMDTEDGESKQYTVEVVDGRYNLTLPLDELFNALASDRADMSIRVSVEFNGQQYTAQGVTYLYLPSLSSTDEIRLERSLVFEAPRFNLISPVVRYAGERLLIIIVEGGEDAIDTLRITVNEGKLIKIKASNNWKVAMLDDGAMLEGINGHALKQGSRLMAMMLKQGEFNYTISAEQV